MTDTAKTGFDPDPEWKELYALMEHVRPYIAPTRDECPLASNLAMRASDLTKVLDELVGYRDRVGCWVTEAQEPECVRIVTELYGKLDALRGELKWTQKSLELRRNINSMMFGDD